MMFIGGSNLSYGEIEQEHFTHNEVSPSLYMKFFLIS